MSEYGPAENGRPSRILVVDDNESNRGVLSRRLRARGMEVDEAEDGAKALDAVATHRYDAVLLDVMMPGISGLEVLRTIREKFSEGELPVLMATARDDREEIVEALRLGANDYFTKPLDFAVVTARLGTHLRLRASLEDSRRLAAEMEMKNAFLRKTFGRYVSAEVVDSLLETPGALDLGGQRRFVALVLADLRGFSALSESLSPEQVVRLLNIYLGAMSEVILSFRGTIDEFSGDGILALFGAPLDAPDDACRAARCAVAMQRRLEAVNAEARAGGLPELEMGVAVHAGEVVVGNVGSEARAKYAVVGSHVNLVGRVETFAVGGQILATGALLAAAGGGLATGRTFSINAKGFRDPVVVHELVGIDGEAALPGPAVPGPIAPLASPVPVDLALLLGKRDSELFGGRLLALSTRDAILETDRSLEELQDLRVRLRGEDFWAKVTDASASPRVRITFTAVPPSARRTLLEASGRRSGDGGDGAA